MPAAGRVRQLRQPVTEARKQQAAHEQRYIHTSITSIHPFHPSIPSIHSIHPFTYACVLAQLHTSHTYIYVYIYIYTHTHIYIYIYMHTHTHGIRSHSSELTPRPLSPKPLGMSPRLADADQMIRSLLFVVWAKASAQAQGLRFRM